MDKKKSQYKNEYKKKVEQRDNIDKSTHFLLIFTSR